MSCRCLIIVALLSATTTTADEKSSTKTTVRFNEDVRPILSEYCFACHGPDAASRKADLRLDISASAIETGAVVPGNVKASELINRINSDDPDTVMPPADSHKPLKAEHKKILEQWIKDGAEWQKHWAFIKPNRPAIPELPKGHQWAGNPIDHFILDKLNEIKLTPNATADRYTVARRAAFDITGLPPALELLKQFVASKSETAWSDYLDRLLASPHYGEHRARYWLDAARYGDTHGMHVDNYREIWPYRDWVVNAFNGDMPFDRFVVEQIAGDLLPSPTRNQLIATGFNRCNITTSEGGAIPAELDVRYMVDRVETTATVFLGLTAGCAVCHDHKYDPISQREFYQLGAFFNNTTQPAMDGNQKDTPPVVTLPKQEFEKEWEDLLKTREQLRTQLRSDDKAVSAWWPKRQRETQHVVSADNLLLSLPLTEGEEPATKLPDTASWETDHPAGHRGMRFGEKGLITTGLPELHTNKPLCISFWYRSPDRIMSTTLFDQTSQTEGKKTLGWKVVGNTQGGLTFEFHDGTGKRVRALLPGEEALKPRSWQHVCVRYSGGQSNSSISILVNGRAGVLRNSTEDLIVGASVPAGPLKIARRMPTAGLSDVRIFQRWLTDEETRLLAQEHVLRKTIATDVDWKKLTGEKQTLATLFHNVQIDSKKREVLQQFAGTQLRRDFIYSRSTTTLVMQERPSKPRAWVLERGEYDQRRDEVSPLIPAVLRIPGVQFQTAADQQSTNRLHLARWLVHPDHPLTARVYVNRLWQSVFGTGLVRTSEDFGVMGDRPSHPELLDWLAVEFIESGWNVKHLMKLILTSSAYQQSSVVTSEKLASDPLNRFLSRGPRIRLDAEMLRDQALDVSGLLRKDFGGPSVKPYQPAGLWKVVAITGSNTRFFKKDTGDALYRRSLYSFWKRTSPPPNMAAFNAPTREQCTVRRERTNTPIQALVLLNDPQFIESARHLAQNAIHQHKDAQARAEWMLKTTLAKPANGEDVSDLLSTANDLRSMFNQKPDAAKELINTGDSVPHESLNAAELAAWTMVANTLMNRDDFINK